MPAMPPPEPRTDRRPGAGAEPTARIFLGTAPDDFDAATDLVIGPWSLLENPRCTADWRDTGYEDPYPTSDALSADAKRIAMLANAIVVDRASAFNAHHGTSYGYEYWRILLLPWVLWISQAVWIRYRLVEAFVERNRGRSVTGTAACGDRNWPSRDMVDLHRSVLQTPEFNEWLSGRIVRRLAPPHWRIEEASAPPPGARAAEPHDTEAGAFVGAARRIRRALSDQRCRKVYGITWQASLFSVYLSFLPARPSTRLTGPAPSMADAAASFPDAFLEQLEDVLDRTVSDPVGDAFAAYDARAAARRYRAGKINLIGPILILNEDEKFVMAHAVEKGERIVCTQHGSSGYQSANINSVEIENRQDAYLSWGWREQNDYRGKVIPLPSPLYVRYRGKARPAASSLLYVATGARIYGHRLESAFQPGQAADYASDIARFFAALPSDIRARAAYRTYANDAGIADTVTPVRTAFPDLSFHKGPLHRDLLRSRLTVIDHYGTTFGIALIADAPALMIWNRAVWDICPQAEDVFGALLDAGIAHTDPVSAARFAADIWENAGDWWRSDAVQSARRTFCDRYALTDRLWIFRWLSALRRI